MFVIAFNRILFSQVINLYFEVNFVFENTVQRVYCRTDYFDIVLNLEIEIYFLTLLRS